MATLEKYSARPRYTLVSAALPPRIDGIGDYTAYVAEELARTADVRVLTATGADYLPIKGVTIEPVFDASAPKSVSALLPALVAHPPDWLIVQFNPFAYGPRGWNPYLPQALRKLRRTLPQTRIAVMAHETAMAPINPKARVLYHLHTWQFGQMMQSTDVLWVSVSHWADDLRARFPRVKVQHLPVGANLPRVTLPRDQARQRLGISPEALVIGVFGQAHISRQFDWTARAVQTVARKHSEAQLLYIGPHWEQISGEMCAALAPDAPAFPMSGDGPFPLDEVARRFCALDMTLCPYVDGVSTRRGAFMASIQYGLATVGTTGQHTDELLKAEDGYAFLLPSVDNEAAFIEAVVRLADDATLRSTIGEVGRAFYDTRFDWPVICRTMQETLHNAK